MVKNLKERYLRIGLLLLRLDFIYSKKYFDISSWGKKRVMQIKAENSENYLNIALTNMIARNISISRKEALKNLTNTAEKCLKNEVNIRWLISSLDTCIDCKDFTKEEKLFFLNLSIFLSQFKFIIPLREDKEAKKTLKHGLTSFNFENGDLLINQMRRITNCTPEHLKKILKSIKEIIHLSNLMDN